MEDLELWEMEVRGLYREARNERLLADQHLAEARRQLEHAKRRNKDANMLEFEAGNITKRHAPANVH